jgi:hypothetical protein
VLDQVPLTLLAALREYRRPVGVGQDQVVSALGQAETLGVDRADRRGRRRGWRGPGRNHLLEGLRLREIGEVLDRTIEERPAPLDVALLEGDPRQPEERTRMVRIEGENATERRLGRRHLTEHHVEVCVEQVPDRDVRSHAQPFRDEVRGLLVAPLVAVLVGQPEHRGRGARANQPGEAAPGALEERG